MKRMSEERSGESVKCSSKKTAMLRDAQFNETNATGAFSCSVAVYYKSAILCVTYSFSAVLVLTKNIGMTLHAGQPAMMRGASLDVEQTRQGLKVLAKYCKKKYCNSMLASMLNEQTANALDNGDTFLPFVSLGIATPSLSTRKASFFRHQSFYPCTADCILESTVEGRSVFVPRRTTLSVSRIDPNTSTLKEELKFERLLKIRFSYLLRILKLLYYRLGLKYVVLLLLLVAYALLGGLLFYYLEAPAERLLVEQLRRKSTARHIDYAKQLLRIITTKECLSFVAESSRFTEETRVKSIYFISCSRKIIRSLKKYDWSAGISTDEANPWTWTDYWNAVFYCSTIFTTIGYGNIWCRTYKGRIATICYALFGIPFMLVVLNSLGKEIFSSVQSMWKYARSKLQKKSRYLQRKIFLSAQSLAAVTENTAKQKAKEKELGDDSVDEKMFTGDSAVFETFPVYLALILIFAYIGLCSLIFCLWEEWDYFTAFYFFCVSLMTIGLGDEMPQHPRYACVFFVFFVIGLSLVSMCISIMQVRVENKYMAALQLIDKELVESIAISQQSFYQPISSKIAAGKWGLNQSPTVYAIPKQLNYGDPGFAPTAALNRQLSEIPRTPIASTTMFCTDVPSTPTPPPVLGVFMARSVNSKQRRSSVLRNAASPNSRPRAYRQLSIGTESRFVCSSSPLQYKTIASSGGSVRQPPSMGGIDVVAEDDTQVRCNKLTELTNVTHDRLNKSTTPLRQRLQTGKTREIKIKRHRQKPEEKASAGTAPHQLDAFVVTEYQELRKHWRISGVEDASDGEEGEES
uniref:Potassium channel domain-containing protein n=1 Tax=Ascaris lumbricoides TaxID=6252 RepID=A0A9J2P2E3_ASCLU